MRAVRSLPPILAIVMLISAPSCKHEVDGAAADEALFREATGSDYTYYVGTPGITPPAADSPHGNMRVRFDSLAQSSLDSATQELLPQASFKPGSIIVKDVYDGTTITRYAVMKKDPASPFAGSGWLWAEYSPDGSVDHTVAKRGDGCISCHSGAANRDLVRIFDLH